MLQVFLHIIDIFYATQIDTSSCSGVKYFYQSMNENTEGDLS